jgi:glutamate-ammonia-ligase adenylyltransferase
MRLRPNGGSGLLVSSLAAFERYQREAAWTWEHQALVRARAVAGDPELMRRFEQVRREILGRERDPERLRADVLEMRARMAGQLDRSDHEWFDVKQGRGGLVDIEFLVQYAVLRWAHVHPGLTDWTDNLRLLERLGSHGLIDRGQASRLRDALLAFRGVIHHSALREVPARVEQGALREARAAVREIWTQVLEEGVAAGPGP